MNKCDLDLLFDYNEWANGRVLAACRGLTTQQMHAPAQCSFNSLMGTLAHVYGAERFWRQRLQEGISPRKLPTGADFPTLAALELDWGKEEKAMRAFLNKLSEEDLGRWVEYQTTSGRPQGSTLWKALVHVTIHGAQFRAEAGAVMAGMNSSPGDLDFIYYLRETDQR